MANNKEKQVTQKKKVALAGLNLLALASTLFNYNVEVDSKVNSDSKENQVAKINASTLKSIESTWLRVPMSCKAKGFNAEPTALVGERPSNAALAVYQSLI